MIFRKNIPIIILSLLLLFLLFPASVCAEEGTGSNIGLSYYELLMNPSGLGDTDRKLTLTGTYDIGDIKQIEAVSNNADVAEIYWPSSNKYYGTIYTNNPGTATITVKVY